MDSTDFRVSPDPAPEAKGERVLCELALLGVALAVAIAEATVAGALVAAGVADGVAAVL